MRFNVQSDEHCGGSTEGMDIDSCGETLSPLVLFTVVVAVDITDSTVVGTAVVVRGLAGSSDVASADDAGIVWPPVI